MEGGGEAEALPVEEEEEEEEPGAIGKLFEQAIELCSKPIGATQRASSSCTDPWLPCWLCPRFLPVFVVILLLCSPIRPCRFPRPLLSHCSWPRRVAVRAHDPARAGGG